MRRWIAEGVKVNMCVTSPPYWGLRDYGVGGQLGLESTPDEFVAGMVEVFSCVRDLLADDGTLWLNLGDSYASGGRKSRDPGQSKIHPAYEGEAFSEGLRPSDPPGIKPQGLIGIPWRVAFALQSAGWYLRQDIIWHKPNPMPESVTDRCTKSHEYLFLLTKSERYYFDQEAILETCSQNTHDRLSQANLANQKGSDRVPGKTNGNMKAVGRGTGSWNGSKFHTGKSAEHQLGRSQTDRKFDPGAGNKNNPSFDSAMAVMPEKRNKRSVWTVTTKPFSGAHFATFPPGLIEPCVLAGSRVGGIVLDPFMGSGTTAQVAQALGRQWLGCELNPEYVKLQDARTAQQSMVLL